VRERGGRRGAEKGNQKRTDVLNGPIERRAEFPGGIPRGNKYLLEALRCERGCWEIRSSKKKRRGKIHSAKTGIDGKKGQNLKGIVRKGRPSAPLAQGDPGEWRRPERGG